MEKILPIETPSSFDNYRDSFTHHYSANVFYDALKREISFAKREGNLVGVVKFIVHKGASADQLLYFANELDLAIRQHDLIARVTDREFFVLLRFDSEIMQACECLVRRVKNMERREFTYACTISDGTKGLEQVLAELDNPQIYRSSKSL
jgi:GGDEF domain-containing protein